MPFAFAEFNSTEAAGVMLAHSLHVPQKDGSELRLRKGHVLTSMDVARLQNAGIMQVSGARLGADDIPENTAAEEIARGLSGAFTVHRAPHAGRCNLHADRHGILVIDSTRIIAANSLDESVAIGTLPANALVRKGQVIATVKIIPCAITRTLLDDCKHILEHPALHIAPLHPRRAALLITTLPNTPVAREKSWAAMRHVTQQRLESLGSRLALDLYCPHTTAAITTTLQQAQTAGCDLILISGAAGTKDRRDLVPSAILAAGGHIERFGTPVEPGNMLLLARLGEIPVLILPGCARSRRLNGLDWVLQRLLADLPLGTAEFAAMGVGGLIRQAPGVYAGSSHDAEHSEPMHEEHHERTALPHQPHIAVLILAAGRSQRMAGRHKLLEPLGGIPLIQRTLNAARASRANSIHVVTGYQAEAIAAYTQATSINVVHNPHYSEGMASSLRCGIAALPAHTEAVLVMLADMPHVTARHLDQLIDDYLQHEADAPIIVPTHLGQRGNPILWPRRFFADIMTLEGDQGARTLLAQHADEIRFCKFDHTAILVDIDTPEDLIAQKI